MNTWKRVHLVGIKGVAMTALAIFFKQNGVQVTGSDVEEQFPTDELLASARIPVSIGFGNGYATQKNKPDAVIYTGAHGGKTNPQVVEAMKNGINAIPHGKALGMIMEGKRQIVVAGSHGKTTTSAMIAAILMHNGVKPSYAIGCGSILGLGPAGHFGTGEWFVVEGDEYVTDPGHDDTPRFMWTNPEILVVTNIDFDHPDAYSGLESVQRAFKKLQAKQNFGGVTVVNIDDKNSQDLLSGKNVVTYGFSPRAHVRITHIGQGTAQTFFTLEHHGIKLGEFVIKVPGRHNVSNAAAAVAAALSVGLPIEEIRSGLATFFGTKRRFEKLADFNGIACYDDYAHHPVEIQATLSAAKLWFPDKKLIVVFQPHTYSRTRALLPEFSRAFSLAQEVIITDIYASAREQESGDMSGQLLVQEIAKHHGSVFFAKDPQAVETRLRSLVQPNDVLFFMGAGDIYTWEKDVINKLTK